MIPEVYVCAAGSALAACGLALWAGRRLRRTDEENLVRHQHRLDVGRARLELTRSPRIPLTPAAFGWAAAVALALEAVLQLRVVSIRMAEGSSVLQIALNALVPSVVVFLVFDRAVAHLIPSKNSAEKTSSRMWWVGKCAWALTACVGALAIAVRYPPSEWFHQVIVRQNEDAWLFAAVLVLSATAGVSFWSWRWLAHAQTLSRSIPILELRVRALRKKCDTPTLEPREPQQAVVEKTVAPSVDETVPLAKAAKASGAPESAIRGLRCARTTDSPRIGEVIIEKLADSTFVCSPDSPDIPSAEPEPGHVQIVSCDCKRAGLEDQCPIASASPAGRLHDGGDLYRGVNCSRSKPRVGRYCCNGAASLPVGARVVGFFDDGGVVYDIGPNQTRRRGNGAGVLSHLLLATLLGLVSGCSASGPVDDAPTELCGAVYLDVSASNLRTALARNIERFPLETFLDDCTGELLVVHFSAPLELATRNYVAVPKRPPYPCDGRDELARGFTLGSDRCELYADAIRDIRAAIAVSEQCDDCGSAISDVLNEIDEDLQARRSVIFTDGIDTTGHVLPNRISAEAYVVWGPSITDVGRSIEAKAALEQVEGLRVLLGASVRPDDLATVPTLNEEKPQ